MTSVIFIAEIISFYFLLGGFYMLKSLALIFLLGIFMGSIFNKLKLPSLLGMLLTGIILGPCWCYCKYKIYPLIRNNGDTINFRMSNF